MLSIHKVCFLSFYCHLGNARYGGVMISKSWKRGGFNFYFLYDIVSGEKQNSVLNLREYFYIFVFFQVRFFSFFLQKNRVYPVSIVSFTIFLWEIGSEHSRFMFRDGPREALCLH